MAPGRADAGAGRPLDGHEAERALHPAESLLQGSGQDDVPDAAGVQVAPVLLLEPPRVAVSELARPVLHPCEVVGAEEPRVVADRAIDEFGEAGIGRAVAPAAPLQGRPRIRVAEEEAVGQGLRRIRATLR